MRAARYRCPASLGLGVWLLCALAAPPLAAQPSGAPPGSGKPPTSEAARLFEEGSAAAQKDQWEKACVAFQKAWALKKHFTISLRLSKGQPSRTASPATATQFFEVGVKAGKQGQWDKAHAAFEEAWRIKKHWPIAANFGRAEIKLGRYREAAEHLAYFLCDAAGLSDEDRQTAQTMFEKARTNIGTLTISVNQPGAGIFVDGTSIGASPLSEPLFVDLGARKVEARLGGYAPAQEPMRLSAGEAREVSLRLRPAPAAQVLTSAPEQRSSRQRSTCKSEFLELEREQADFSNALPSAFIGA